MTNKSDVGRRVILADDTTFEDSNAGSADGVLWCRIATERTFAEIAEVFTDPEKTQYIRFEYGEMDDEYEGYTRVHMIMQTSYGFDVSLMEEEAE